MKRINTIQTLLRILPLVVVGITLTTLYLHDQQIAGLKHRAFESMLLESQQQARGPLKRLFEPVTTNLSIARQWLQNDTPDLKDTASLNSRLMPVLHEVPQIASAMVADTTGREYMLLRTQDGWLTRSLDADNTKAQAHWQRWTGPDKPAETWEETLEYDPRNRPWFRGAVDSDASLPVFWTSAYHFFTSKELGMTAASRIALPAHDGKLLVVAFDVRLTDISELTHKLLSNNQGKAFIFSGDGRVLGVPDDSQFSEAASIEASELTPADSFPDVVVREAYTNWLKLGRPEYTPFEYTADQATWWSSMWQYPLGNRLLWLAVTAPETELIQRLGGPDNTLPAIVTGAGFLFFIASLLAAIKYRPDIAEATAADSPINTFLDYLDTGNPDLSEQLLTLIHCGESERLEFKSSVRWNFKAGRPGKEMELAWLKTVVAFMNSEGGIILLGVDDEGQILGLHNDGFTTNDKALRHIENLIAQHLGPAHFPRIHSRMITVADKQVLMIACEVSKQPVFLKHEKGEDFYIRTGPASRSLATSEALAYIGNRKPL